MGMFDSIYMKVKCPFCGIEKVRECQTKDLDNNLERWNVGDNTGHPEEDKLDCIVGCEDGCGRKMRSEWLLPNGQRREYISGRHFYIFVKTPLGLVTGEYEYQKWCLKGHTLDVPLTEHEEVDDHTSGPPGSFAMMLAKTDIKLIG